MGSKTPVSGQNRQAGVLDSFPCVLVWLAHPLNFMLIVESGDWCYFFSNFTLLATDWEIANSMQNGQIPVQCQTWVYETFFVHLVICWSQKLMSVTTCMCVRVCVCAFIYLFISPPPPLTRGVKRVIKGLFKPNRFTSCWILCFSPCPCPCVVFHESGGEKIKQTKQKKKRLLSLMWIRESVVWD